MSNEISYSLQLRLANGNLNDSYTLSTTRTDQTTAKLVRAVQEIGTSEEALDLADLTTPGYAVFQNLDDTNYVEVGNFTGGTFYPFLKLKAEEHALCRIGIPGAQLYAKANTAAVDLFYIIYDD